jgi:GT2 family glycosyltransferase
MLTHARPDLSIIIVSWNVRDLLRRCLATLPWKGSRLAFHGAVGAYTGEVIVVDNASADSSAAMLAAEFPAAQLIANTENRGFTGGNNQGIAASHGRYVLFLNPDTEVMGNALGAMLDYLEARSEVGALGPELRYGDGTWQSSRRRFPTLMTALTESTPLAWHWPHNRWARRYRMEDMSPSQREAEPVDWVVGAALLTRREVLAQIGGFDEDYFMYSEELDWCRRAKTARWEVVYLPTARVIHHEGKSSEQVVAARHIRFNTSKVRYFRKFHGRAAGETVRLALLGMFAGEWLLEGAKWVAGSQRALRRERMAAYRQLLGTRLRTHS